jgi:hypothetical protein
LTRRRTSVTALIGQLHHMKVIDDQDGAGQRLADGRFE